MTIVPPEPTAERLEDPLTTPAPQPMGPITKPERIAVIDILRGMALFGIIAANIRGFAGPALAYFNPAVMWQELPDRLAQAFIDTFIQGKFITIFAFLFGVGFAVQLSRAEARGSKFGGFYSRRLLVLALIGLVHGLLIWWGDILLPYALTGFLLFFFKRRKDSTLWFWATLGYLGPLLLVGMVVFLPMMFGVEMPAQDPPDPAKLQETIGVYATGSWSQIQSARMREAFGMNWAFFFFMFPNLLGLFLFGMLAWRKRLFQPSPESLPTYRKVMIWGYVIGIAGNVTATAIRWVFPMQPFDLTPGIFGVMVLQNLTVPALSAAYACTIILLCQQEVWQRRFFRFGAVGRTALSNYLLQSVLGTLIFYSYGLGLYGEVGPALLLIPTVLIYWLQTIISPWWLSRWRFGPVEWLWRSLTYGRIQPMMRVEEAAGSGRVSSYSPEGITLPEHEPVSNPSPSERLDDRQ